MSNNISRKLDFEASGNLVRLSIDDVSTNWIKKDDSFFKRIAEDNLNPDCPAAHLKKEIQIRNLLDEGIDLFKSMKYSRAIERLDEVLFYDPEYGEALIYKSYCLESQRHFVKALRHYRRAVRADESLRDSQYHRKLLSQANDERSKFPKLKQNIYAGDEHFARGEYQSAVESYDRALKNPSKFKGKILSRLLNKKAEAYLKMGEFDEALRCFEKSSLIDGNDHAIFGEGICRHELGLDINTEFRSFLKVSKEDMLNQALILKDLGYLEDSMRILDFLRKNHFRKDELYEKMMAAI